MLQRKKSCVPIIVPIRKMISKKKSCNSLTDMSILEHDFNSRTPRVHAYLELMPLIDRCYKFMDYHYTTNSADLLIPSSPESRKKMETIETIYNSISDPISRRSLPLPIFSSLLELAKNHIFHKTFPKSFKNDYAEVQPQYAITHWDHIETIHKLFYTLILDHEIFTKFLDINIIRALVEMLSSPCRSERKLIEQELKEIISSYYGQRTPLLHLLLSKIFIYSEGLLESTMINHSLNLFLTYWKTLPNPLSQSHFLLFRRVFYPLISTPNANDFEGSLTDVALFFQSQDPATALWSLQYLKNHWPITSSKKIILFLHQISSIIYFLPSSKRKETTPIIAELVSNQINAENSIVSTTAMSLAQQEDFIDNLKPFPELFSNFLIPATRRATLNWNDQVSEMAKSLLNDIERIGKLANKATSQQKQLSRDDCWNLIQNTVPLSL